MILEPNRLITDWLNGTLTDYAGLNKGVGAALTSLFTSGSYNDSGDAKPSTPTAYDETRNAAVARNDVPDTLPAILVSVSRAEWSAIYMAQPPRVGTCSLLVRYVIKNSDTDEGVQDAAYVLRAILISIQELWLPQNDTKRTRNGVTIYPVGDTVTYEPMQAQREDGFISFGLTWNLDTRSYP